MTTRFSSLAALAVTLASLALGGCAAGTDDPNAPEGESTNEAQGSTDEAEAVGVRGFTVNIPTRYYYCDQRSPSGVSWSTSPNVLDATGLVYQYYDRTIPGGRCLIM